MNPSTDGTVGSRRWWALGGVTVAVLAVSGEKKNSVARPTWNMPSAHWLTRRTVNRRRKPTSGHSRRRSSVTCTDSG